MKAWEYRTTDPMPVSVMNELGQQGWEVVAVYPRFDNRPALIWKRPTPSAPEPQGVGGQGPASSSELRVDDVPNHEGTEP